MKLNRVIVPALAGRSVSSPSFPACPSSQSPLLWPLCPAISQQDFCLPSGDGCNLYLCLEDRYHCTGSEYSYPIDYGFKFCERYTSKLQEFDAKGKTWVYDVRLCLQNALAKYISGGSNCKAIYEAAFASHAPCYLDNGVCDLSVRDFEAIMESVGLETLFNTMRALEQSLETGATCVVFWTFLAERGLKRLSRELDAGTLRALSKLAPIGVKKGAGKLGQSIERFIASLSSRVKPPAG